MIAVAASLVEPVAVLSFIVLVSFLITIFNAPFMDWLGRSRERHPWFVQALYNALTFVGSSNRELMQSASFMAGLFLFVASTGMLVVFLLYAQPVSTSPSGTVLADHAPDTIPAWWLIFVGATLAGYQGFSLLAVNSGAQRFAAKIGLGKIVVWIAESPRWQSPSMKFFGRFLATIVGLVTMTWGIVRLL